MNVTFAPRGILQIDGARITHKNFGGVGSKYNREGDRNFSLIIDDPEIAERLTNEGWNVKYKPAREEGEDPFMYLQVKVKFSASGPSAYLESGNSLAKLDEDTIGRLDKVRIANVDLDIRPYDWEVNGRSGRTAYLQAIKVTQRIDRFAAQYENEER